MIKFIFVKVLYWLLTGYLVIKRLANWQTMSKNYVLPHCIKIRRIVAILSQTTSYCKDTQFLEMHALKCAFVVRRKCWRFVKIIGQ